MIFRKLPEQGCFLGTGDGNRPALGECHLEPVDLEPAELVCLGDPSCTGAANRRRVRRHGFLAGADHQMRCGITHRFLPRRRSLQSAWPDFHASMRSEFGDVVCLTSVSYPAQITHTGHFAMEPQSSLRLSINRYQGGWVA